MSNLVETRAIEVVPRDTYASLEQAATERVPHDRCDWPTVALAMTLAAGILTGDNDFLGCGCRPGRSRRCAASFSAKRKRSRGGRPCVSSLSTTTSRGVGTGL